MLLSNRYISYLDVPDLKKSTLCQADNTRSEPLLIALCNFPGATLHILIFVLAKTKNNFNKAKILVVYYHATCTNAFWDGYSLDGVHIPPLQFVIKM